MQADAADAAVKGLFLLFLPIFGGSEVIGVYIPTRAGHSAQNHAPGTEPHMPRKKTKQLMTTDAAPRYIQPVALADIRSAKRKVTFIEALGLSGTIKAACEAAGISRAWYYRLSTTHWAGVENKHYDAEFCEACEIAITEQFKDAVMASGIDRALNGWEDRHYDRAGTLVRTELKYDSAILQLLMKKVDPSLREPRGAGVVVDARTVVHTAAEAGSSAALLDDMGPEEKRALLMLTEARKKRLAQSDPIEGEVVAKT